MTGAHVRGPIYQVYISTVMLVEIAFASNIQNIQRLLPGVTSANQLSYSSPLFLLGVACSLSGAFIRLWSYQAMGVHFTFQLSLLKDHKLVTTGPYAYARHPAYTALIMNLLGVFICELASGSWYMETRAYGSTLGICLALFAGWMAAIHVSVVLRAPKEDKLLSENFGEEWKEWAQRVPYRFVPGVL